MTCIDGIAKYVWIYSMSDFVIILERIWRRFEDTFSHNHKITDFSSRCPISDLDIVLYDRVLDLQIEIYAYVWNSLRSDCTFVLSDQKKKKKNAILKISSKRYRFSFITYIDRLRVSWVLLYLCIIICAISFRFYIPLEYF